MAVRLIYSAYPSPKSNLHTYSAFWTNGRNWPVDGEIDIVEGVHDYTNNQMTIHTDNGCTLPASSSSALAITGSTVAGTNCAASQTGNQGCGIRSPSGNSLGATFNSAGGGVYASKFITDFKQVWVFMMILIVKWDDSGILIYFFSRNSIPQDITNGAPDPDSWGTPQARWASSTCNPYKFFVDHVAILDTTLW